MPKKATCAEKIRAILRDVYGTPSSFENWIMYLRNECLDVALPGETGFDHAAHMEAMRDAIATQRDRLFESVEDKFTNPMTRNQVTECEKAFQAALHLVAERNVYVREACRYEFAVTRQRIETQCGTSDRSPGIKLVHSRD